MIYQIIKELKKNENWQIEAGEYILNVNKTGFDVSEIGWFLEQLGISDYEKLSYSRIQMTTPEAYISLKEVLNKPVGKINSLTGRYAKYNDLTPADWRRITAHSEIMLHDHTSNLAEKDNNYAAEFSRFLETAMPNNVFAYRMMNEFKETFAFQFIIDSILDKVNFLNVIYGKRPSAGLMGNKLIFDLNTPTLLWLKKNEWQAGETDGSSFQNDIITGYFHNLHLTTQYARQLSQKVSSGKKISAQTFIKLLTAKAEMTAYDLIMQEKPVPHVCEIMAQHKEYVMQEIISGKLPLPFNRELNEREKLDAMARFVVAESIERTVQTICECYLSSSRLAVYETLKTQNISLSGNHFNCLNSEIDSWKEYIYTSALREQNYTMRADFDSKETAKLQKKWEKKEGLLFDLNPSVVFSPEIAQHIGVYEAIYGQDNNSGKENSVAYTYQELSVPMVFRMVEMHQAGDYDCVLNNYRKLQSANPFLPSIQHIKSDDCETSKLLVGAVSMMVAGKPVSDVLQHLGYAMTDTFDERMGKQIEHHRQTVKMNRRSLFGLFDRSNQHS